MAKYNERLVEKAIKLIESDDFFTITEICDTLHISRKTFYKWKQEKPEFKQAIDEAIERQDETIARIARNSLKKRLEGHTIIIEEDVYMPDKNDPEQLNLTSRIIKKKQIPPSISAIIFVLERDEEKRKGSTNPLPLSPFC